MDVKLAYFRRSGLVTAGSARVLSFAPKLARDPVAFDAQLLQPLRFREAISALHDVVISDLRFQPRDKTAYEAWKKAEAERDRRLQADELACAKAQILAQQQDVPQDLERAYERSRKQYWNARQTYANYLLKNDMDLWRKLMPCDPVVTVARDAVFFECFSADESSYGCLTVDREGGFGPSDPPRFGTTNVDYSWELYRNFQALRSYRETRFRVDPQGFEVATQGSSDYREEKIDLPPGWLRGFLQIQSAMAMPMRRVAISREAVYSLLAWHKRHKARMSPRALRFELLPGRAPAIVMEPWEKRVTSHGTRYDGPPGEPVRVWGARRLLVLARLLPLAERFEVTLLGTGMPSFWTAHMGEMRLTLGLSGWTANDWTRGSALDALAPPAEPTAELVAIADKTLRERGSATLAELAEACVAGKPQMLAALNRLALTGQAIHDLGAGVYRRRQIMPMVLGEAQIGPENAEVLASRALLRQARVRIERREEAPRGGKLIVGRVEDKEAEVLLDADGAIRRGKCVCSHHHKAGIRMGPCRHLLALRGLETMGSADEARTVAAWYEKMIRWAGN